MCSYRRRHLKPNTIRSLLLVYHSQIIKSRLTESSRLLSLTIDIDSITEEEIEAEIKEREYEVNIRKTRIDYWDQNHYINNVKPIGNIPIRTIRMQLRTEYF
jgi:hypothetical protein